MKTEYLELLVSLPLFKGYTLETIKEFAESNTCTVTEHEKDEVVLVRGDTVRRIAIVLSGSLTGQIESRDGTATTINYFERGSVFGDVLSGSSGTSPVTVITKSSCTLLWLELSKVLEYSDSVQNKNMFLQNYIREVTDKYFALHERVQILCERKMRDKILAYFSLLSERQSSLRVILPQRTRSELANYLGCDRSALTRELSKMQEENIIWINKKEIRLLAPID